MESRADVVVVGGGPAGAAAALLLSGLGHEVALFDEARFPRDKVCGEAVSPGAWRQLEALGVAAAVATAGVYPLSGMRLVAPDGSSFSGLYGGGRVTGFSIERRTLDAVLLGRARDAGVRVYEGAHVARLRMSGDAVTGVTVVRGGETCDVSARLVVDADGRGSRVARSLGLLDDAPRPRRFAVRCHWDRVEGMTHLGEMHVGIGSYCGIAPLGPTSANVTFVLDQLAMGGAARDIHSFYLSRLRHWPRI